MKYICIILLVISCNPYNPEPEYPSIEEQCDAACINLKKLNYNGWQGSPGEDEVFGTNDDISCKDVCIQINKSDMSVTLNQNCVMRAKTKIEVDKCFE